MTPANVRKALRRWRANRDTLVELLADGMTDPPIMNEARDNLLSSAEEVAVALDRWLAAPSPTPTREK